jgi:hypothetical protein
MEKSRIRDPGWKSRIRDKHPGSATLKHMLWVSTVKNRGGDVQISQIIPGGEVEGGGGGGDGGGVV